MRANTGTGPTGSLGLSEEQPNEGAGSESSLIGVTEAGRRGPAAQNPSFQNRVWPGSLISPDNNDRHFLPMSVLIDTLKSDEVHRRVKVIESLEEFCLVLGPLRTREEMIPFIIEFMEDEEEVIMALVDSLPRIANCLGGPEHLGLILESMKMLFTVDNQTIVKKVQATIKCIYDANKDHLRGEILKLILLFWPTEELHAKLMCIFFYRMMIEDMNTEEKATVIKTFVEKLKHEDKIIKKPLYEAFSNPQSAAGILEASAMKQISDDISKNLTNTVQIEVVKGFLIGVIQADIAEMNAKVFAVLKEINNHHVKRPYFAPSVLLPTFKKLQHVDPADATLYDPNAVWKRLLESEFEKEKDQAVNFDVKDSRIRKEVEIFAVFLEYFDFEATSGDFFTQLETLLLKDDFLTDVLLKSYWKLRAVISLATDLEKKTVAEGALDSLVNPTWLKSKVQYIDKIIEGIKVFIKACSPDTTSEELFNGFIALLLEGSNWQDRRDLIDIIVDLAKQFPQWYQNLFQLFVSLALDPANEVRQNVCQHLDTLVSLQKPTGNIEQEIDLIITKLLEQKSCYRRLTGVSFLEVAMYYLDLTPSIER